MPPLIRTRNGKPLLVVDSEGRPDRVVATWTSEEPCTCECPTKCVVTECVGLVLPVAFNLHADVAVSDPDAFCRHMLDGDFVLLNGTRVLFYYITYHGEPEPPSDPCIRKWMPLGIPCYSVSVRLDDFSFEEDVGCGPVLIENPTVQDGGGYISRVAHYIEKDGECDLAVIETNNLHQGRPAWYVYAQRTEVSGDYFVTFTATAITNNTTGVPTVKARVAAVYISDPVPIPESEELAGYADATGVGEVVLSKTGFSDLDMPDEITIEPASDEAVRTILGGTNGCQERCLCEPGIDAPMLHVFGGSTSGASFRGCLVRTGSCTWAGQLVVDGCGNPQTWFEAIVYCDGNHEWQLVLKWFDDEGEQSASYPLEPDDPEQETLIPAIAVGTLPFCDDVSFAAGVVTCLDEHNLWLGCCPDWNCCPPATLTFTGEYTRCCTVPVSAQIYGPYDPTGHPIECGSTPLSIGPYYIGPIYFGSKHVGPLDSLVPCLTKYRLLVWCTGGGGIGSAVIDDDNCIVESNVVDAPGICTSFGGTLNITANVPGAWAACLPETLTATFSGTSALGDSISGQIVLTYSEPDDAYIGTGSLSVSGSCSFSYNPGEVMLFCDGTNIKIRIGGSLIGEVTAADSVDCAAPTFVFTDIATPTVIACDPDDLIPLNATIAP